MAAATIPLVLVAAQPDTRARAERWAEVIKRLARVSDIGFAEAAPPSAVQLVVRGEVAALPLAGIIDLSAERARLDKEMSKIAGEIRRLDGKLNNADFVARAPEDVVEAEREKREEYETQRGKLAEALERLKGLA
jgi:valyl-tRNA synthetase